MCPIDPAPFHLARVASPSSLVSHSLSSIHIAMLLSASEILLSILHLHWHATSISVSPFVARLQACRAMQPPVKFVPASVRCDTHYTSLSIPWGHLQDRNRMPQQQWTCKALKNMVYRQSITYRQLKRGTGSPPASKSRSFIDFARPPWPKRHFHHSRHDKQLSSNDPADIDARRSFFGLPSTPADDASTLHPKT